MNANISREAALSLLREYNKESFLFYPLRNLPEYFVCINPLNRFDL